MKKLSLLIPSLIAFNTFAYELEPIIVSSKQSHSEKELLDTVSVYKVNTSDASSSTRVVDLLGKIPGVEVIKSGLFGGTAGVAIRGQETRHTLVLVDGKKLYDSTTPNRGLNLNVLNTSEIEKIEVLKGAQSVMYGSDAIGGVVNIITKKADGKGSLMVSGGYYSELGISSSHVFQNESALKLSAYVQNSDFDSEAKDGTEKDQSENKGFDLKHTFDYKNFSLDSNIKYSKNFSEVDEYDYTNNETIDDKFSNNSDEVHSFGFDLSHKANSTLDLKYIFASSRYNRSIKYKESLDYTKDSYEGGLDEFEFRGKLKRVPGPMSFGIHTVSERYESDDVNEKIVTMNDVFLSQYYEDRINFYELGGRIASNNDYGSHLLYSLGYGRNLNKENQIKLTHKTAYKAPSVYQLRGPETSYGPVGNENLGPEKSRGVELAYLFNPNKQYTLNSAIFYNEVEDLIDFKSGAGYVNEDYGIYRGLEIGGNASYEKFLVSANATFLNISLSSGDEASNRPDFSLNTKMDYKYNDHQTFGFVWNWKGRRFETVSNETFKLSPYDSLDLNYSFSKNRTEVVATVINVFDREYEVKRGYSVLRRALQVGMKYKF